MPAPDVLNVPTGAGFVSWPPWETCRQVSLRARRHDEPPNIIADTFANYAAAFTFFARLASRNFLIFVLDRFL